MTAKSWSVIGADAEGRLVCVPIQYAVDLADDPEPVNLQQGALERLIERADGMG